MAGSPHRKVAPLEGWKAPGRQSSNCIPAVVVFDPFCGFLDPFCGQEIQKLHPRVFPPRAGELALPPALYFSLLSLSTVFFLAYILLTSNLTWPGLHPSSPPQTRVPLSRQRRVRTSQKKDPKTHAAQGVTIKSHNDWVDKLNRSHESDN